MLYRALLIGCALTSRSAASLLSQTTVADTVRVTAPSPTARPIMHVGSTRSLDTTSDRVAGEYRLMYGAGLSLALPAGAFGRAVQDGVGFDGHGMFRLGSTGALALRAEGGMERYGDAHKKLPFSSTIGELVQLDVETSNEIYWFGAGPELMAPRGIVRPYGTSWVGVCDFNTSSSVRSPADDKTLASSNNLDYWTFEYGAGVGVLVRILRDGPSLGYIDIGARFHANGRASYLVSGAISQTSAGGVQINPTTSTANFWTYHIGFSLASPIP